MWNFFNENNKLTSDFRLHTISNAGMLFNRFNGLMSVEIMSSSTAEQIRNCINPSTQMKEYVISMLLTTYLIIRWLLIFEIKPKCMKQRRKFIYRGKFWNKSKSKSHEEIAFRLKCIQIEIVLTWIKIRKWIQMANVDA